MLTVLQRRVADLVESLGREFGRTALQRASSASAEAAGATAEASAASARASASAAAGGAGEEAVRGLDFVISTGDNNYWHGNCDTFEQ